MQPQALPPSAPSLGEIAERLIEIGETLSLMQEGWSILKVSYEIYSFHAPKKADVERLLQTNAWYRRLSMTKEILDALEPEASKLSSTMSILQHSVSELANVSPLIGIESLPDDILYRIFDMLKHPHDLVDMGGVCRRFRRLTFDQTICWARIDCDWPLGLVDACIQRSREQPLQIKMCLRKSTELSGFLDLVVPASSRWQTLRINRYLMWEWRGDGKAVKLQQNRDLTTKLVDLHVPLLKTLDIDLARGTGQDVECLSFLASWIAPKLQTMDLSGILPQGTAASLFSFELTIQQASGTALDSSGWELLVDFLIRTSTIEVLRLSFSDYEITQPLASPIHLPNIKTFSFSYSHEQQGDSGVTPHLTHAAMMLKDIQVPNAISLDISLDLKNRAHPPVTLLHNHVVWDMFFPFGPLNSEVDRITVTMKIDPDFWLDQNSCLQVSILPFCVAPRFHLQTNLRLHFVTGGYFGSSRLKDFDFYSCGNLDPEGLTSFVTSLKEIDAFDAVESFGVSQYGCDKLTDEDIAGLFPIEKRKERWRVFSGILICT